MMCVCVCVSLRMKWVYHDSRYYHDDIGVDVVRAWLIWVPVIQHHTCVVDWGQKQKQLSFLLKWPQVKPALFNWKVVVVKEQSGVSHKAECSCICSCFCSPLSGLLCDCRAVCTLVAARSGWEKRKESQISTCYFQPAVHVFFVRWRIHTGEKNKNKSKTHTHKLGQVSCRMTEPLTSNSSQKPCLTLSVASASLLSSRTRLSISAALIRVVFRGWGGEQESAQTL